MNRIMASPQRPSLNNGITVFLGETNLGESRIVPEDVL